MMYVIVTLNILNEYSLLQCILQTSNIIAINEILSLNKQDFIIIKFNELSIFSIN